MNILIIFIVIAIASLTPLAIKQEKTVRTSASAFATVTALLVLWTVWPQLFGRAAVVTSWWLIDGFSAMMASLVAILFFAVALVSHRYIGHERHEGIISDTEVRVYYSLLNLFVLSMLLTVMTNNTLVLWLALESTTLSSTFLVGLYRKKTSIEAAWKYVIICSTGITLGLIGILLLGYGTNSIGNHTSIFLLSSLTANAALLPVKLVKLAFVFLFIGFGAKVGFVPTHTWLPDAHSNAPSPISALFSGILLNVALYAIIRFQLITDRALGSHTWTSTFYLIFGSMSVLLPASLLLIQRNYKRMLAYSSIEHMGLIAFGLAVPPIGTIAAVMHMAGHTLVKSSLFFGAGEILLRHKTTHAERIRGILSYAPYTGVLFLLGILAIIAMPPSVLFVSEFSLIAVLIQSHVWLAIILLAALGLIAFSMLRLTVGMLFADRAETAKIDQPKERWNLTHTVMSTQLLLVAIMAVWFSTGAGQRFVSAIASNLF